MDPPACPPCLIQPYSANPEQKGGTLIAPDIWDAGEHKKRLASTDGYRPSRCDNCGDDTLHAHDFRYRQVDVGRICFRRYLCYECKAVWTVLAAFIARCLHQRWETVQAVVEGEDTESVSRRTGARWRARLACAAMMLVQVIAEVRPDLVLETSWTRGELIDALVEFEVLDAKRKFAELAAWVHRLKPGLRLI